MKRLLLGLGLVVAMLLPAAVQANAPGLQVSPLLYEDNLTDKPKNGHIDVANPTDATITVDVSVRGFKQQGHDGNLVFYDDPDLAAAIRTDLKDFELGPREAIRVLFSVDPSKLPRGGVFAAIFFTTHPQEQVSNSSYVSQSANVGTLLVMRNGGDGAVKGGLTGLTLPLWQFGAGIAARVAVENAAPAGGGVAFRPELSTRVLLGKQVGADSGLVLPGATREFDVSRPGGFFGILPFTVADKASGTSRTGWVIACTGWCQWVGLVVLVALLLIGLLLAPRKLLRRRRRRKQPPEVAPEPEAEPEPVSEVDTDEEPLTEGEGEPAAEPGPEGEPEPEIEERDEEETGEESESDEGSDVEKGEEDVEEPAPESKSETKPKPKQKRKPMQLG